MKDSQNTKPRPRDGGPVIGLHTLKGTQFKLIGYVILVGSIMLLRPSLWTIMLMVSAWSVLVSIYYKRFKIRKMLIGLAVINVFIIIIYGLYKLVGGVWALILAHIIGVALIIYVNKQFIQQAHNQITTMVKELKQRKGWNK